MAFPYCLLSSLIVSASFYGASILFRLRKKESLKDKWFYLNIAIDLGVGFIFSLIVALFIALLSGGMGLWSGLVLFSCIHLLPCVFHAHAIIKKPESPEEKNAKIKKISFASVLSLGLLLEVFMINAKSFKDYGAFFQQDATSYVSTSGKFNEETGEIEEKASVTVTLPEEGATNARFDILPAENTYIKVTVKYAVDGVTFADQDVYQMDASNVDFHIIPLSGEGARVYRFEFDTDTHYLQNRIFVLESISFNVKPRVNISLTRIALYSTFVSICFIGPKVIELLRKRHEVNKIPYLVLAGMGLTAFVGVVIAAFVKKEALMIAYPIAENELGTMQTDIFAQLFDAFRKGQVYLDIKPSDRLLALENPYDPKARSGVFYLWDHAFYGGKYYCYYGAVPVLLVNFPMYFLSGCTMIPTAFCLELVGMALLVPAFFFLVLEIYRFCCKKVSYPVYIMLCVAAGITSLMIMAVTFEKGYYQESIYHVPDIYGLLFFDLFFGFVLNAYRSTKKRVIPLGLSGLFCVLMIGSRPNLFVAILLTVPFYLAMLIRKEYTWRQKLLQFSVLGGVLLIGAVALCAYNKVRFDSIMEFGQSYQLTVSDQTSLTYASKKLLPSIIHFFLQGPAFYNKFPYYSASVMKLSFDDCPYIVSYQGVLTIPLFWGAMLLPAFLWKGSKIEIKAFSFAFPIFAVIFAFTTYSKAGICPRYMIELYHAMTVGALFAILYTAERMYEKDEGYTAFVYIAGGVLLISAFQCLCLSFDTFDGMNTGDANGFFLKIKSIFQSFNF